MGKHRKELTPQQTEWIKDQQKLARKGLEFDANYAKLPQEIREKLAAEREKKKRWWQR